MFWISQEQVMWSWAFIRKDFINIIKILIHIKSFWGWCWWVLNTWCKLELCKIIPHPALHFAIHPGLTRFMFFHKISMRNSDLIHFSLLLCFLQDLNNFAGGPAWDLAGTLISKEALWFWDKESNLDLGSYYWKYINHQCQVREKKRL